MAAPEHADVQLPALDVGLYQRIARKLLMNESHSLNGLSRVADKGRLAYAVGRLLTYRLDKGWVSKALETAERRHAMGDDETG